MLEKAQEAEKILRESSQKAITFTVNPAVLSQKRRYDEAKNGLDPELHYSIFKNASQFPFEQKKQYFKALI